MRYFIVAAPASVPPHPASRSHPSKPIAPVMLFLDQRNSVEPPRQGWHGLGACTGEDYLFGAA
jgi:hypothetical protein